MREQDYEIIPVKMVLEDYERFILLRHDVDFYLDYAVELAEFEHDQGIKSSYYILLHSPFYNVLAPKSMEQIRKIEKLGHEIGWHVDFRYTFDYDERRILQDIIKGDIESYSLHIPEEQPNREKPNPYYMLSCKEINQDYEIKYISDSGRYWREDCMCQHIGNYPRLQILIHPVWWTSGMENRDLAVHHMVHKQLNDYNAEIKGLQTMMRDYLGKLGIAY